ncbi:YceI family protein [Aureivirga sp. CE67]|uniref:YceI family protein n=1 Tax=Aureivirga sp. CE67 TaxID=1788983 RepID=UPI0018CB602A|nr:YceI family protein [Aureivirga sp. CE67]
MNKKVLLNLLLVVVTLFFASCEEENTSQENSKQISHREDGEFLQPRITNITWTAFKTEENIPLSGIFKKSCISNSNTVTDIKSAVNGSKFSVPVSSLFTDHEVRDFRIVNYFFKMLDDTEALSGYIYLDDDTTGFIELKANGVTKDLPFTYEIQDSKFKLTAMMNVSDWGMKSSLDYFISRTYREHSKYGVSGVDEEVEVEVEITADPGVPQDEDEDDCNTQEEGEGN